MVTRKVLREYIAKCDLILDWARNEEDFNPSFIHNVKNFMQNSKNISIKQRDAIDNIINSFQIGFIEDDETKYRNELQNDPEPSIKDYDDLFNVPLLEDEAVEEYQEYNKYNDEFGLEPVFDEEPCIGICGEIGLSGFNSQTEKEGENVKQS